MMKKRGGPAPVDPVCYGDKRYEAIHWGKERGLGQNGGYVAAYDRSTDKELWKVEVYKIEYTDEIEADKQDVFLVSLTVDASGSQLLTEDERGRHFSINLFSKQVTAL